MKKNQKYLFASIAFLISFALWTIAVSSVNVSRIGPNDSCVGFSAVNGFVHKLTGVHLTLYNITDWLGLIPVGCGFAFAALGLVQWIRRKSIKRVDASILVLGGFYIVVFAAYLLFEEIVVNYRPILINGVLEASYPSSTTLLVLCIMPTTILQLRCRISNTVLRCMLTVAVMLFIAFMVLGRLISGVHWLSDIIGGILLSGGLVTAYRYICSLAE